MEQNPKPYAYFCCVFYRLFTYKLSGLVIRISMIHHTNSIISSYGIYWPVCGHFTVLILTPQVPVLYIYICIYIYIYIRHSVIIAPAYVTVLNVAKPLADTLLNPKLDMFLTSFRGLQWFHFSNNDVIQNERWDFVRPRGISINIRMVWASTQYIYKLITLYFIFRHHCQ